MKENADKKKRRTPQSKRRRKATRKGPPVRESETVGIPEREFDELIEAVKGDSSS